jgi:hypothetical protein
MLFSWRAGVSWPTPQKKVEGDAIRERVCADVDSQLPLGAELKAWRQPHHHGPHRVLDLARGIHCREPIRA